MFSWANWTAKKNRTSQRRKSGLRFEGLEDRSLLAGVVNVSVAGGIMLLTGDTASNGVEVISTGVPGQFNVVGVANVVGIGSSLTDISSPTLIRLGGAAPAAAVQVNGVSSIYANLGDGNDQFALGTSAGIGYYTSNSLPEYAANFFGSNYLLSDAAPTGSAAALAGSITILGGNGSDAIVLFATTPGAIYVDSGAGHDYVISERTLTANLSIQTGVTDTATFGSDRIRIRNSIVTAAIGVNTYEGSDFLQIMDTVAAAVAVNLGNDGGRSPLADSMFNYHDRADIMGVTSQAVAFTAYGSESHLIFDGDREDLATLPSVIGTISVITFGGHDVIGVNTTTITKGLTISTGLGADILFIVDVTAAPNVTPIIDMGAGPERDVAIFLRAQLFALYLFLGDGDDEVEVEDSIAATAYLYGMGGNDLYTEVNSTGFVFVQ